MRLNLDDGRRRPPEIHPLGADGTSRSRSQQGGTLLEALVAIVIVSVLLVGVIAGMATSTTVSQSNTQTARARAALAAVSDRVATMPYPGCGDAAALTTTVRSSVTVPDGLEATVTDVANLVPASASCTAQTSVRMLTIELSSASTQLTGQVVLRDPAARPS